MCAVILPHLLDVGPHVHLVHLEQLPGPHLAYYISPYALAAREMGSGFFLLCLRNGGDGLGHYAPEHHGGERGGEHAGGRHLVG